MLSNNQELQRIVMIEFIAPAKTTVVEDDLGLDISDESDQE
jgi:hypothetical protein